VTRVLMVGCSMDFLRGLGREQDRFRVTILEEPDIFAKRELASKLRELPCIDAVLRARYQQSGDAVDAGERAARDCGGFDAVVPGVEYAVPAAAALAERLGLPGATWRAAGTLRDKLALREVASRGGVPCPDWREIHGPADVVSFAGSGPVVIKPADRQASVGVQLLDDARGAHEAWAAMIAAGETTQVPDRALRWRHMAERRLFGREYSIEALVRDGELLFHNITEKEVVGGRHPVELGHCLPGTLGGAADDALREMRRLVAAVGFRTGMLHAEWMLTAGGPVLIECAGRAPGDRIPQLIDLAYETTLFAQYLDLMAGRPVAPPRSGRRGAAIRFLSAARGTVFDVTGADRAAAMDGVHEVAVSVRRGDVVGPLQSSWDRCGHVIATAPDAAGAHAHARAAEAAAAIRIATRWEPRAIAC
jgi:biotin carboxylase